MPQIGRLLVRSQLVTLKFFIDIKSCRSHYGPGGDTASNRNEYREHFLGGKGGRCVRLTILSPSCVAVMKSRNLNFLEPSGPLQACNGTALPLPNHGYKLYNVRINFSTKSSLQTIFVCAKAPPVFKHVIYLC